LVDEDNARAPKVEDALHLLDRAAKDFAHVDGGADQRRELSHHREPRRGRAGAPHRRGHAVRPRCDVELLERGARRAPLVRRRVAALQPAARQLLEIAGSLSEIVGAEARSGPGERMGGPVQDLGRVGAKPGLELGERLVHRLDPPPETADELRPDFSKGIGGGHAHSSRICRASSSGWNGLSTMPTAPDSASRRASRSRRAVSKTIGTSAVTASPLSRWQTSYPSISGIITSTTITC